ncbi:1-acyl-sn-glycerol-3-phosphate acyltransferase [Nitrincola alkalisediminis]|uniref:1-acyl-sn-glycerol-3-phosphate acyltransferase n=1 Tax=Nitrincola alkalisediminis TaxID=1366656 RepID=UPI00187712CE|nr:1-acyl-sn-glycerol-3-phosphate acyltransferase [Nitrincola alkalisediminis]
MTVLTSINRCFIRLLTRIRVIGQDKLQRNAQVYYVLEHASSVNRLILAQWLEAQGVRFCSEQLIDVNALHTQSTLSLEKLIDRQLSQSDDEILLQPITLLVGHMPASQPTKLMTLFNESWTKPTPFLSWFNLLIKGRSTLIRIDEPLHLRDISQPGISSLVILQRCIWLLSEHFQRTQQAILGPDLSSKRALINQVIMSHDIQNIIYRHAQESPKSIIKTEAALRAQLNKMIADFRPQTARVLNRMIAFMLKRLYQEINLSGIESLQKLALTHNLVYLPCHRSHLDYILLSWLLYQNGLMVPHVVAGDNLNIPIVGKLLRQGGAIFIRRQFKGDRDYSTLFRRYLILMMQRGHSIEYFVEGGRSRTGRLLPAKTGLLDMTLDAASQLPTRPIAFIPVWIGYDRLVESHSYQQELSGQKKKKESLIGTLKSARILFQSYGKVSLNIGEAVLPDDVSHLPSEQRVHAIAHLVMSRINAASVPMPMSLIATLLLSTPNLSIAENDLTQRIRELYAFLLPDHPSIELPIQQWCQDAIDRHQIIRNGAFITVNEAQAAELTFYRNMLLHEVALPGLWLLVLRRLPKTSHLKRLQLMLAVYPFLAAELSLNTESAEPLRSVQMAYQALNDFGLLSSEQPTISIHLMRLVEPILLRQYLLLLTLQAKTVPAKADELIARTQALAIEIHDMFGFHAPEYADKRVLESFINQLLEHQLLVAHEGILQTSRPLRPILRLCERILSKHLTDKAKRLLETRH